MLADVSYEATYIVLGCMVLDVINQVIDLKSNDDVDVLANAPANDAAVEVPTPANEDVNAPRDVSDDAPTGEAVVEIPSASQEVTPVDQADNNNVNQEGSDAAE